MKPMNEGKHVRRQSDGHAGTGTGSEREGRGGHSRLTVPLDWNDRTSGYRGPRGPQGPGGRLGPRRPPCRYLRRVVKADLDAGALDAGALDAALA